MNEDVGERILQELKKHHPEKQFLLLFIFLLVGMGVLIWEVVKPEPKEIPSWTEVDRMSDRGALQQALKMAQGLVNKTPNAHRAHSSLGSIHLALGNKTEAAKCYARAYELFPDSTYRDTLRTLESSSAIIADGDLPAGTILTMNNMAVKTCRNSDLNDDGIGPNDVEALLGHRLTTFRKQFEPIRWHDTDLVITNQSSLQVVSPCDSSPRANAGPGPQEQ